jgi:hypothetical protein
MRDRAKGIVNNCFENVLEKTTVVIDLEERKTIQPGTKVTVLWE